jgi:hypothetical protein
VRWYAAGVSVAARRCATSGDGRDARHRRAWRGAPVPRRRPSPAQRLATDQWDCPHRTGRPSSRPLPAQSAPSWASAPGGRPAQATSARPAARSWRGRGSRSPARPRCRTAAWWSGWSGWSESPPEHGIVWLLTMLSATGAWRSPYLGANLFAARQRAALTERRGSGRGARPPPAPAPGREQASVAPRRSAVRSAVPSISVLPDRRETGTAWGPSSSRQSRELFGPVPVI